MIVPRYMHMQSARLESVTQRASHISHVICDLHRFDRVLYKCFPVILARNLMHLSVTICPRATNAYIQTDRHYRGTAPRASAARTTRHGAAVAGDSPGRGFYKGRYCGPACRPSDHGEYRLLAATADKPNVSHSFVSKPRTANKPRAVIWHRCLLPPVSSRAPHTYLTLTNFVFHPPLRQCPHPGGKIPLNPARNRALILCGD